MGYRVPVGGIFASIYYEIETGFQVFGDPIANPDYYLEIDRMLGHGVRITSWRDNNNVNLIRGLNNIEAANATDGPYEGELTVEFEAVGDLAWAQALMGNKTLLDNGKTIQYDKKGVPPSLTFVIYIQNDANVASAGDVFILRGVIMQSAEISVEGTNVPLHVKLTCPYADAQTVYSDEIPDTYAPSDNAFNFGQAMAYFWHPGQDISGPASFNSMETIAESFVITIDHGGELIRGIGSRKARDKFHKFLDYRLTIKSYYRDKERLLDKFYGCKEGPMNDTVPAFKRITLVVQNCRTCGDAFRKMEFEFNVAKMNTRDSQITADEAITETYDILPLNAVIRVSNGDEPDPVFDVSPYHIKQGDLVVFHTKHFPRGSTARFYIDGGLYGTVPINCSGEGEYRIMAGTDVFTVGNHTICARAYTGSDVDTEVYECQDVFVTEENVSAIPKLIVCPQYYRYDLGGVYSTLTIKGFNIGTYGVTSTATMAIYTATANTKVFPAGGGYTDIKSLISGTIGVFDYDTGVDFTPSPSFRGEAYVEFKQVLSTGGSYVLREELFITDLEVDSYTAADGGTATISAYGLKPNERCAIYIEETPGSGVMLYKGVALPGDDSTVTVTLTGIPTYASPGLLTEFRQRVLMNDGDGTGVWVASETLDYTV